MVTVLTGGTGGAKFVDGLRKIVPPEELTVIVNTGDDLRWWGLYVSPDLDSITYMLADKVSEARGWGVEHDTFFCLQTLRQLGEPAWFQVGDRDLALHIFRSKLLAEGKTLTHATAEIARRLGIKARILPMSDAPVETRVLTPAGDLSFEEFFVQRRFEDPVESVRFEGALQAVPAPGVLDAIRSADLVLLAPSNPVTSIGPILAVPGIREALRETSATIAAVSPVIGGAAVTGPAGALLAAQGFAVSIAGIAEYYEDFLDVLVADSQDAVVAEELRDDRRSHEDNNSLGARVDGRANSRGSGLSIHCTSTMMRKSADRVALAKSVMEACAPVPSRTIATQ